MMPETETSSPRPRTVRDGPAVRLGPETDLTDALRQLKRQLEAAKLWSALRRHARFESPGARRRRKHREVLTARRTGARW
jgi:ribosomal protein S21